MRVVKWLIPFMALFAASTGWTESIRETQVTVYDEGTVSEPPFAPAVDTDQGSCGTGTDVTSEPFFDTLIGLTVKNPGLTTVKFSRFQYSVRATSGTGTFRSKGIALSGPTEVPPDNKEDTGDDAGVEIRAFLLQASSGFKHFIGDSSSVPSNFGVRTIRYTLTGKDGRRRKVTLKGRISISFHSINRCESSS